MQEEHSQLTFSLDESQLFGRPCVRRGIKSVPTFFNEGKGT